MTRTRRNRVRRRLVRAVVAGSLIAVGVGLGAFNDWWVALFFGIPLVFAGIAISPRASRVSELPEFRRATSPDAPQVEVEALTRSSLTADDVQPTMVTATINPPDDTAYRARWITSMTKGNFQSLTDTPFTTLPPDALPPRDQTDTPEFDDQPGRWALAYPAVTLFVAGALLFGVAGGWHVEGPSLSGFDSAIGSDDESSDKEDATSLADQHRRMLDAIAEEVGPQGVRNVLSLSYQIDSPSAYARVFDPATGRATNINIGDGYSNSSIVPNTERANKTFDAAAIDPNVLGALVDPMTAAVRPYSTEPELEKVEIERRGPDGPVLIEGTIEPGEGVVDDYVVQATPDGTVAEFFDPADFGKSFELARRELVAARVPLNAPVIEEFIIQGIADGVSPVTASVIQNSGGVLVRYRLGDRGGEVAVAPGEFPVATTSAGRYRSEGFRFDSISADTFDRVRADLMRRASVPEYDRNAVGVEVERNRVDEAQQFVIRMDIANTENAEAVYTLDGRFIKEGRY
ncbi:hypothetical protein [Gordonia terrae]|uniref:Uncharacterized protein n=2 Tax=Gordonia terrae TaxID=2055 RepID=A0AAD0KA38_9ACTN|nr:hypothetical protein [Gordonia terrae]VTR02550.1 Uncharacterised protein [Clostridioides difficile]ANY23772.1 hypothetical protein BCM27_14075 [Gordonia terrae]AWO84508.1 hypothetical protein DLJ61_14205 [Gordonia terrae]VTS54602.1 Uncharacterised protein [Gordonia terrae]GAB45298.1 hypothetical protein GOTRE_123_00290 [Gordonia terrae NBRC 100016]